MGMCGIFQVQRALPAIAYFLGDVRPQAKPFGNHLVDLPLPVLLPDTLVAWQARLLPWGELVTAGGSDAEQLVSLNTEKEPRAVILPSCLGFPPKQEICATVSTTVVGTHLH